MVDEPSRPALVTGAAGALGRSVVGRFLAAGQPVVAVDASVGALDALAEAVDGGEHLELRRVDLASSASVAELFSGLGAGPGAPAAVAHLVGGFRFAELREMADEDWSFLLRVNLETTFRVLRESARAFAAAGGGALVAVAAPAGLAGEAGVGAYAATKAGVLRLVESLARELAPLGGRANAVLPGTMDTPGNRAAMPDADPSAWVSTAAVAEIIHYLTTPAAAGVNGAAVRVPGPTL